MRRNGVRTVSARTLRGGEGESIGQRGARRASEAVKVGGAEVVV